MIFIMHIIIVLMKYTKGRQRNLSLPNGITACLSCKCRIFFCISRIRGTDINHPALQSIPPISPLPVQ